MTPTKQVAAAVDKFNAAHPIGTTVRYWTGLVHFGKPRLGDTRSTAWALGGHSPVVLIEGYRGGVALSHIEVVAAKEES